MTSATLTYIREDVEPQYEALANENPTRLKLNRGQEKSLRRELRIGMHCRLDVYDWGNGMLSYHVYDGPNSPARIAAHFERVRQSVLDAITPEGRA